MFNEITGINESKTKPRSQKCKCRSDGKKHNTDQWWNNDKAWCECKKRDACEKDNIWKDNILHVIVKMENI